MDDLVTITGQSAQLSLPAQAPTVQGVRRATAMPPPDPPSSAPLPAGESMRRGIAPHRSRLYLAVEPLSDYYEMVLASGVVGAIELVANAPRGCLLVSDDERDPERGRVHAERCGDGWHLTGAAS